jgi:ribosomal protein L18E
VLGDGVLSSKIDITATAFSVSAKLKIQKAGGAASEA